ncbi:anti-sigma factor family protein [Candidatus Laterigemmans baculatus]|uniref:anti-sigma factor family protein n=1 Tax=Candidatus Laterigemmans baculatus TaxID=2770505 RepID=UPI0013D92B49|nr:RseA family anti-sigma factor [Candidatus Laterigemmans baculatus]
MSLPRELLDELLSAYMDGELSADEHARVEQMLAADPELRESLRLLEKQAEAIRHSLQSAPRLGCDFSERVLAATFAEAQRQSLDPAHPVRKAAAQPAPQQPAPGHSFPVRRPDRSGGLREPSHRRVGGSAFGRRHYIAGLAIAASLALAAVFYRGQDGERPLAKVDVPGHGPLEVEQLPQAPLLEAVDQLAEAEDLLPEAGPDSAVAASPVPAAEQPAASAAEAPRMAANAPAATSPAATSPGIRTAEAEASRAAAIASDQVALRAVLVYEVNLTPLGRQQNVVNRAFREAQIRTADQREIDESLVSYLRSGGVIGGIEERQTASDGSEVSVLFLEGSGKRLEKLMLTLLAATEEVHSVGFSLAMDPPVMAAIDSLREVDPTKIRGDAASVLAQPLAPQGLADRVGGFTAGSRSFTPLNRDALQAMAGLGGMTSGEETDITAMTFLIIRSQP